MRLSTLLRRDVSAALITRCDGQIRALDAEKRTAELSLSSETPVARWGDQEILSHAPAAIRLDRLRNLGAIHLDHDNTKPVAAIREVTLRDGRLYATVQFGRTALADDAWKNVQDGVLRGVSVGYRIHKTVIDENKRTITATDWEPYEASLTTIPADPTVGVGRTAADQESLWRSITKPAAPAAQETPVKYIRQIMALIATHRHLQSELIERGAAVDSDAKMAELAEWASQQAKPGDQSTDAKRTSDETAKKLAQRDLQLELVIMARSHGVELSRDDAEGITTREAGLELILKRAGERNETRPGQNVTTTNVTVTAADEDKRREAAVDGLLAGNLGRHYTVSGAKDLGMRRMGFCDIMREALPELARCTNDDLANLSGRRTNGLRLRDANQSAANFSTILGNYIDKVLLVGYNQSPLTHTRWTSERLVDDFKTVYGVAAQAGLLKEQSAKGVPGEEFNLTEQSYSTSLGLFMRTLKLAYQDVRNDDLGQLTDVVRNIGMIAAITEEWQVYKALLGATWTNNETTSAAYWDDTNDRLKFAGFGATQGALEARKVTVGDESIQLNPVLGFVLATTARAAAARAIIGAGAGSNGSPIAVPVTPSGIEVISVPWLSNSTLTGYNADDYFLVAKNMDTVKVLRDRLYPAPRVMQIDAGATPDQHFLAMHAFRAKIASMDGLQKGNWS